MKKRPSFQHIQHFSKIVEKNELFTQYSNESFGFYYEANYIQLYFNPTLAEFHLLEKIQADYQISLNQHHLNFHWPKDTGLYLEVLDYLSQKGYEIGKLELFHLAPKHFNKTRSNPTVHIQSVTDNTLAAFLALNFDEDRNISPSFAEAKQNLYRYQYEHSNVSFLLATIKQEPIGSLLLIESADYLEVDNVLTAAFWRKKGVASELLDYVRKQASMLGKEVILLADTEASPREMYLTQGFQKIASQIHALKKL